MENRVGICAMALRGNNSLFPRFILEPDSKAMESSESSAAETDPEKLESYRRRSFAKRETLCSESYRVFPVKWG